MRASGPTLQSARVLKARRTIGRRSRAAYCHRQLFARLAHSVFHVARDIVSRAFGLVDLAFAFARTPNGGLIATAVPQLFVHRAVIIALAARHNLLT
jgi:hypothetical protein